MDYYDFRSDTSTLPTPQMMAAVAGAELGNDGYGEDPTTRRLEELAATIFGKEESMVVPSGTMGNLIALMTHCNRGDEVIVDSNAHVLLDEMRGLETVAQLVPRCVPAPKGIIDPEQIDNSVRLSSSTPRTGLVWIENTHNREGGTVVPREAIEAIAHCAHRYTVPIHIDGARIFNAAMALDLNVQELVQPVDSVMFCLSKGLGCPVGSMLLGSSAFIEKARRTRRLLGGGMRQAGIIAGAGLVALSTMVDRLRIDHWHAKQLAAGLREIPSVTLAMETVQTNIVRFVWQDQRIDGDRLTRLLKDRGVLVDYKGNGNFRMVTHKDIDADAVEIALREVTEISEAG